MHLTLYLHKPKNRLAFSQNHMASLKAPLVREELVHKIMLTTVYCHKISVLMVLIIEACKVFLLLHKCWKSDLLFFSVFLTAPGTKTASTWQPFILLSFSKLHCVPHMILHQVVYVIVEMADCNLQRAEVFSKKGTSHL